MKKANGFTLVELLVTMSVVAVLVTLAAPSVAGLVQSGNVASAVNTLLGDLRFSRSEAVRRGVPVVICRSSAPEATSPQCASDPANTGSGWSTGWIIFEDRDSNASFDSGTDKLLRVQAGLNGIDQIKTPTNSFEFTPMGRQKWQSQNITFGGDAIAKARQRLVCVAVTGRARVAGDGNASCT